ncbi:MAG TPA: hypothetical protein VIR03_01500 [Candidatus Saccharimonadales bacterium]
MSEVLDPDPQLTSERDDGTDDGVGGGACAHAELDDLAYGINGLLVDIEDRSYSGTTRMRELRHTDGLVKVVFTCGRTACDAEFCALVNTDRTWATLLSNDDPQKRCAGSPPELI